MIILRKLTCLILFLFLTASVAMAATISAATIDMSASEWESNFRSLLAYAEASGVKLTDNPDFSVALYTAMDGTVGLEHSLDIAGFMQVAYYDNGDDVFNSAVLTINLDHGGAPARLAMLACYYTVLAGDTETTEEEFYSLLEALCPFFEEAFTGEERVNGAQAAALRGVGYGMEISDDERYIRLFTNVSLTANDAQ